MWGPSSFGSLSPCEGHRDMLPSCPLLEDALAGQPLPGLERPWATSYTRTALSPCLLCPAKVEGQGLQAESHGNPLAVVLVALKVCTSKSLGTLARKLPKVGKAGELLSMLSHQQGWSLHVSHPPVSSAGPGLLKFMPHLGVM